MIWKKLICICVCLLLILPVFAVQSNGQTATNELAALLGSTPEMLMKASTMEAGDSTSDWTALIAARNGYTQHKERYLQGLWDYVSDLYAQQGGLDPIKATLWHRISLTVLALGADPTCFGVDENGDPIDLIADGTYHWETTDSLGTQGNNAWIYALMVLDSLDYEIPDDARYTREMIIENILLYQLEDGGFHIGSGMSEVDVTAMALQALAPYYGSLDHVSVCIDRALEYLSAQQNAQGDFGNGGSESCSQVILALCALGIDPEEDPRFVKEGGSALGGLLLYHNESGFSHLLGEKSNTLATQQAAQALTALDRLQAGKTRLYDFADTQITAYEPQTQFPIWIGVPAVAVLAVIIFFIRKGKKKCTV